MHFGESLSDDRFMGSIQLAHQAGIRTFMTADVYGQGEADRTLNRGLAGFPRDSYCLVGAVGHDFYKGQRSGARGFPRFTDPQLRPPAEFADYLRESTERALERCGATRFDLLLLHNPDSIGYSDDRVWKGMEKLKDAGLADHLGIAPGPANGFTLDIILSFERFAGLLEWAMIILNPLEPWPGRLCLPAAEKHGVKLMTRVVDYGGLFHDDVRPGHEFRKEDHRVFRPAGWVEAGCGKLDQMRPIAEAHGITLLQLACLWNLAQPAVKTVIPTLIQEAAADAKPIEDKIRELASLPETNPLTESECEQIGSIGDNQGCMKLKGANPQHEGDPLPDQWGLREELEEVARRWGIEPEQDLVCTHAVG